MDYLLESSRTMPTDAAFHGDLVPRQWAMAQMRAAISAGMSLDAIKKAFFYGKDKDGNFARMRAMEDYKADPTCAGLPGMIDHPSGVQIIHAVLGIFTEAVELLEALYGYLENGDPVDAVNLKEEVGDGFWYVAILCRVFGFTFEDAMVVNIKKLFERFPDRFDESQAINRNVGAERVVLERSLSQRVGNVEHVETHRIYGDPLDSQVDRLAAFILENFPGEPSQNEGAIDTAIRLLGQSPRAGATPPGHRTNHGDQEHSEVLRAAGIGSEGDGGEHGAVMDAIRGG